MSDLITSELLEIEGLQTGQDEAVARLALTFGERGIARVLLVVPPDGDQSIFDFRVGKSGRYYNCPPYGLGLLARRLIEDGIEVEILNLNNAVLAACIGADTAADFDYAGTVDGEIDRAMARFRPDLVGITSTFTMTHQSTVKVCDHIRTVSPDVPIALGGVHITNIAAVPDTRHFVFEHFKDCDFLFPYEAELAFRNFVRVVNKHADAEPLAQVMLLRDAPMYFKDRMVPARESLDVIPAYELMEMGKLSANGKVGGFHCFKEPTAKFATVLSNRGCRAQCTFCSVRNFNGIGVRGRSIQSVIDEMLILRNEYGIDHFMWLDDDLLYDERRALALFNEMVKQKVGLTWDCSNGVIAASCTEALIMAAAESGCLGLNIGMESGNPTILRQIRKPGAVKNFLEAAKNLRKAETIHARILLMIGFPGETFAMIQDTINVAREMDLDWSYVTPLQILPNTTIFNQTVGQNVVDSSAFQDVRYPSGAYGKMSTVDAKTPIRIKAMGTDFKNVFADAKPDAIPTAVQINKIWAYMNYHINFSRLMTENRPTKLRIGHRFMRYLSEQVAPDEVFVHYFRGVLERKISGKVQQSTLDTITNLIATAPYWNDRLLDFGLSPADLEPLAISA